MKNIVCWWSGGVTSAVACKLAVKIFGSSQCRIIMIDTHNEDDDTYRFKQDCENWYEIPIETISAIPERYSSIEEVWDSTLSLNVASGAICSTKLKREVRERWQKQNPFKYQVFGFEFSKREFNRALGMNLNHPDAKSIFPLLMYGYDKENCFKILDSAGIKIPGSYLLGFHNNNCLKTGCVQGGIGYWQKIQKEFPEKFNRMVEKEHTLSHKKRKPCTILRDQKSKTNVFLRFNPEFPQYMSLENLNPVQVKPLYECNGFCGIDDLVDKQDRADGEIFYEL